MVKYTKIDSKKFDEILSKELNKYFSKVSKERLETFKELIKRDLSEISDTKDTEDYNFQVISGEIDKETMLFTSFGQKDHKAGDILEICQKNRLYFTQKIHMLENFEEARKSNEYAFFPFSNQVLCELRGRFILQTEMKDNFPELYDRLQKSLSKYLSKDEIGRIKTAIKKSEKRLRFGKVKFPLPYKDNVLGDLKELNPAEAQLYGANTIVRDGQHDSLIETKDKKYVYDERGDDHDLLALKELVLTLEGKAVSTISIGPGFFSKYMPELIEVGIDGIIFKVVNNSIEDIKVTSFYGRSKKEYIPYFSPVKSAVLLSQEFAVTKDKNEIAPDLFRTDFKNINENFIENNTRYYVVVDGMVSAPNIKEPYSLEFCYKNIELIPAGEVFLYENRDNQIMSTRLYFTPYDYSKLHLIHQSGSVVFGNNDQTLHSCDNRPAQAAGGMTHEEDDMYKEFWKNSIDSEMKEPYSPAMMAGMIHHQSNDIKFDPIKILYPQNQEQLKNVAYSIYEISYFTAYMETEMLINKSSPYTSRKYIDLIHKMNSNYSPLTKRFLLSSYLTGEILTKEIQPTWYNSLASAREQELLFSMLAQSAKTKYITDLIDQGSTYEEAKKMADEKLKDTVLVNNRRIK